ncbi:MAG: aspartate kinase [Rickettsiales bacterium]
MALIVQKFGGTSVGSVDRIKHVAGLVKKEIERGNQVVVVASAMSGVTDQLVTLAREIGYSSKSSAREYDHIISTGENVSCGLLAIALQNIGIPARSLQGWQVRIETDQDHSEARILNINPANIADLLKEGIVPVVCGFQGVNENCITTLGRGGSDTTAAAIAAAIKADRCDIYTDVDGVYTADPRIVQRAKKLAVVSYEEMLEMASSGAKVLHPRAVEIAEKYNIQMQVLSTFSGMEGTLLTKEGNNMEAQGITGITGSNKIVSYTIKNPKEGNSSVGRILKALKDAGVSLDMFVQNFANDNNSQFTFTVNSSDSKIATEILNSMKNSELETFSANDNIAKISLTGGGVRNNSETMQKMFHILSEKGINVLVASTSEIKISMLIQADYMELAMRSLHTACNLDS